MTFFEIAAYVLAGIIVLVLCRIFIRPLKHIGILAASSALGGVGLWLFNFLGGMFGFSVGINLVTAPVCGLLGLPGLILLVVAKLVYTI